MTAVVVAPDRVVVATRPEIHAVRSVEHRTVLIERSRPQAIISQDRAIPRAVICTRQFSAAVVQQRRKLRAVVAAGIQGPPGVAGGEEVPYAERIDWVSDNAYYKGEAAPGSSESAPVWRIRSVTMDPIDDDKTTTWAGGSAEFNQVWNDRAGLAYS